jgi:hypothetical protein
MPRRELAKLLDQDTVEQALEEVPNEFIIDLLARYGVAVSTTGITYDPRCIHDIAHLISVYVTTEVPENVYYPYPGTDVVPPLRYWIGDDGLDYLTALADAIVVIARNTP